MRPHSGHRPAHAPSLSTFSLPSTHRSRTHGSRPHRPDGSLRRLAAALLLIAAATADARAAAPADVDAGALLAAFGVAPGQGATSLQVLHLPAALRPGEVLRVSLRIDGEEHELELFPHSLRAPGFRVLVQGDGGAPVAVEPDAPATLRGRVVGLPGSVVAASLIDGQLHALVSPGPGRALIVVQPASLADAQAPQALHLVYDSADASVPAGRCATPEPPAAEAPAAEAPSGSGDAICEIACDADAEFHGKNGNSVPQTVNDIEMVLNGVEAIYEADVGVLYAITTILVHSSEPDPYSSSEAGQLLTQFTQHWNAAQTGVQRDIAQLFTGKNLNGGTIGKAQLSVICSQTAGYSIVESKYTSNLALRVALSAHELGHNWSAAHCDGEGGCSIMCSVLGGCSGNVGSFNASSKSAILAKKAVSFCLDDVTPPPPPVLSSVSPASMSALYDSTVTLTGSGFLKATEVHVGSATLANGLGFQVQSDTQLSFAAPKPAVLGPVGVVVDSNSGSSGALTFTYLEMESLTLFATQIGFSSTLCNWKWGGHPGDGSFLLVSISPATVTVKGEKVLAANTIIYSVPLDAAGLASLGAILPAAASGLTFASQAVSVEAGALDASNVTSTLVLF